MKHILLATCLALPLPAFAQDDVEEGFSLMEEGAKLLFRGLMSEMEPALEDFAQELEPALDLFANEMGPAFLKLMQTIDSVSNYQAPEVLPNGDILIRRRPNAPEYTPQDNDEPIDL